MEEYKVLIVDDEEINRDILSDYLEGEFVVELAADGEEAMKKIEKDGTQYIAMLLDLQMPKIDGFEVIRRMNEMNLMNDIPVLVITGEKTKENEKYCFELGATEFIEKPFEPYIVRKRVENIVKMSMNQRYLEEKVRRQTKKLEEQYERLNENNAAIINAMGNVVEFRHMESGEHVQRVKKFTKILAKYVMQEYPEYGLTEERIEIISQVSPLHDLGKIAISDSILEKPGKFTPEEFLEMQQHTIRGCQLLAHIDGMWSKEMQETCYEICRYHHEKYDGKGYPEGLVGDQIPISAQIVSIADCYDALVNKRVYKPAYGKQTAYEMIRRGECGVFSEKLLHCLELAKSEFEEVAYH